VYGIARLEPIAAVEDLEAARKLALYDDLAVPSRTALPRAAKMWPHVKEDRPRYLPAIPDRRSRASGYALRHPHSFGAIRFRRIAPVRKIQGHLGPSNAVARTGVAYVREQRGRRKLRDRLGVENVRRFGLLFAPNGFEASCACRKHSEWFPSNVSCL